MVALTTCQRFSSSKWRPPSKPDRWRFVLGSGVRFVSNCETSDSALVTFLGDVCSRLKGANGKRDAVSPSAVGRAVICRAVIGRGESCGERYVAFHGRAFGEGAGHRRVALNRMEYVVQLD